MAGTTATPRTSGISGGHPAEIEGALKVRDIDDMFEVLSDYDTPFLSLIGGVEPKFEIANAKYEWGERDRWNRRFALGVDPGAAGTTLNLNESRAHQIPRGTILKVEDELIWVQAQVDADDLTVVRGYAGTTGVAHAIGTEVLVAGFAEVEGADVTVRHTPVSSTFFNYPSMYKSAVNVTWRQNVAAVHGRSANDIDELIADEVKQAFVALNQACILSQRYAGSGANDPASMGGIDYFLDSTNSHVTDLNGAAFTEKHLMDMLQDITYDVGRGNMATTVLCGAWPKRKFGSFHMAERRLTSSENSVGMKIDRLETDFGPIDIVMDTSIPNDRLYLIDPKNFELGAWKSMGRLAEYDLATQGDTIKKMVYGDYAFKVKRPMTMGKIIDISTTS